MRTLAVPTIDLSLNRLSGRFVASMPARSHATLTLLRSDGTTTTLQLHAGSASHVAGTVHSIATLRRAQLSVPASSDVTFASCVFRFTPPSASA